MSKKNYLSKSQIAIIGKLKMGWYLQCDLVTLMWQIKNEELSEAERINKNSINKLFLNNMLKKLPSDDRSLYNLYILKE